MPFDEPPQLRDRPLLIQKKRRRVQLRHDRFGDDLQYRVEQWHPDEIVYVVGRRRRLHFQQVFATARLWGYRDVVLRHVAFGTVLGEDGKPFRARR